MRSTEKINFQSARGEAAKESVQEMVSKPWQNYFDDIEGPNVPVTLLEGNVKNIKVKIDTQILFAVWVWSTSWSDSNDSYFHIFIASVMLVTTLFW